MNNSSQVTYRRSRIGALVLGVVALGCAALAAASVSRMLLARGFTRQEVGAVVVAARDLPAARAITPEDLQVVEWPRSATPAGAYSTVDALFSGEETPLPTAGILKGEPVVASRLASAGAGTGLARLLNSNKRAVAVEVDPAVERTGLVFPGAVVDVIITLRDPERRESSSRIAVQNVRVLTVGAQADVATKHRKDSTGPLPATPSRRAYLTLEVDPADAELIALAQSGGRIDIALRSGDDQDAVETEGATPGDLTGREARRTEKAAAELAAREESAADEDDDEDEKEPRRSRKKRSQKRARVKSARRSSSSSNKRSSKGGMRLVATE